MAVIVDSRRLRNLIGALESGKVGKAITEPAAERGLEIVINNFSGIVTGGVGRSLPGQPPAMETGSLARSGKVRQQRGGHRVEFGGRSQPNFVNYAKYLEYGTSRMAPRPYMRPAALQLSREINGIAKDYIVVLVRNV